MKSKFLLVLFLVLASAGCSAADTAPGIEGYIVRKEDDSMLVVSSMPKDFSASGGMKSFYDAIWFSNAPEDVEVGQKVQVWYRTVKESYPAQSSANKVRVLPGMKPNGADLSENQAILKALQSRNINGVPAIKQVDYDSGTDTWIITFIAEDNQFEALVEDH